MHFIKTKAPNLTSKLHPHTADLGGPAGSALFGVRGLRGTEDETREKRLLAGSGEGWRPIVSLPNTLLLRGSGLAAVS